MAELAIYALQLSVAASLMALALSIYLDGIGYVALHVVAVAGVGGYVFAILTSRHGWPAPLAALTGVAAAAMAGLLGAEALRSLRGDGLTLATFGMGVAAFEVFRYADVTGGVFGIAELPALVGDGGSVADASSAVVVLLAAVAIVRLWRRSIGGRVVVALRMDEWAAVSIGAPLLSHQRVSGILSGAIAGLAGVYLVSITHFIEPRDFQVSATLLPLAAVIIAGGRTPYGVALVATLAVLLSQAARFAGGSAVLAGPLTEIVIATVLGISLVLTRVREGQREHVRE